MKPSLRALRRSDEGPHRPAHVFQARGGRGSHDTADLEYLAVAAGGGELSAGEPQPLFADPGRGPDGASWQPPAEGIDTSEALVFRGWNYRPEVVQDNTNKFNEQYSENVDYQTITGDYISIMENFHIANQPLDMAYANPATLSRWQLPGWVHDYEAWWDVDDARGEMYEGVRESLTIGDKLYGLPYFVSIRGTHGGEHGRPRQGRHHRRRLPEDLGRALRPVAPAQGRRRRPRARRSCRTGSPPASGSASPGATSSSA